MKARTGREDLFDFVYQVVRAIPPGRVTSYGAVARCIGTGMSSRMVGWAMHAAPPDVPAHRVVNRNGLLSGKHAFGEGRMQALLEAEGVVVEHDAVRDFRVLFWDPATELPGLAG